MTTSREDIMEQAFLEMSEPTDKLCDCGGPIRVIYSDGGETQLCFECHEFETVRHQ